MPCDWEGCGEKPGGKARKCKVQWEDGQGEAARLYGGRTGLMDSESGKLNPIDVADLGPFMRNAQAEFGEVEYERVVAEGRAMTMEQAVTCALAQSPR
jgi:hypothetical protein